MQEGEGRCCPGIGARLPSVSLSIQLLCNYSTLDCYSTATPKYFSVYYPHCHTNIIRRHIGDKNPLAFDKNPLACCSSVPSSFR